MEKKEEVRICPHCKKPLEKWLAPPETGWGYLYVCFNSECPFYRNSKYNIINKGVQNNLGCRYAEDPANNYHPINLLAYCPF